MAPITSGSALLTVGVPREIKPGEQRIAVTPDGVRELVAHDATVIVEVGAGGGAGIPDDDYRAAGASLERKRVRPALVGSHEAFLHGTGVARCWLDTAQPAVREALVVPRLERAIGVIYRPQTERGSHYFDARLADQFDVVIHLDHTRALTPLERSSRWDQGEPPETFPSGE